MARRARPRRQRSRRAAALLWPFRRAAAARPELHDRPPPRWTGVPVERDPATGRLFRGDPTGRSDKGRSGRFRRGAFVVAAAVLVLGAAGGTVWALGTGGPTTPTASRTALPTTTADAPTTSAPPTTATTAPPTTDTTTAATTTTPLPLAPEAPAGLTATPVDETAIQLTWTDLSSDETAFEIDDGQVIRTAVADAQDFLWDGLTPGQQGCFRIRAVGAAGASAWEPATDYVCAQTWQPDLVAQPIQLFGGDPVCTGDSPTFEASALNAGSAASDDFVVEWIPDQDPPVDESTTGLPPQAADKHEYTWIRLQAGPHQLAFAVDAADQVAEADEANNQTVLTFDVVDCPP